MTPTTADHPTAASDRTGRSNVKTRLTPNRRHRSVENDEYASFTRRVLRAYARRVAAGDVDALAAMTGMATGWTRQSARMSSDSGKRVLVGRDRGPAGRHSPGSTATMGPPPVTLQAASSGDHLGTTRYARGRTIRM